ncbi:MAG: tetratricopeptide repeat protein [Rhodospirillales bacterium]|nr:tetratricopeptide repeat protein [Rhodospirillales bacterium]
MIRLLTLALIFCVLASPGAGRADQNDARLETLFARLQGTTDPAEAATIEQSIWSIWIRNDNAEIDKRMALALKAMSGGALKLSLVMFNEIIAIDPAFAEAWNKRATAYYLLGQYAASVHDIQQTLALEPRHFGALSGMGLIYSAIGEDKAALKVWQKALSINPQMPGIKARAEELRQKLEGETT